MNNKSVSFTVFGDPKGKGRPRFRRIGKFTSTYTPKETIEYENKVKKSFKETVGKEFVPYQCPVKADITSYMRIPKSLSKKKQEELDGTPHTSKPDTDNIEKSILDPLNKLAYKDDSQVYDIHGSKYYSTVPRVEVSLYPYRNNLITPFRIEQNQLITPIRFVEPCKVIYY